MSIREAIKEDATQIKDLVADLSCYYLHTKEDPLPNWLSSSLSKKEFETRINNNEFTNLIYENNGSIIGYISIKLKGHIYHLFVSQKFQRKGIATKLWESAKVLCPSSIYTVRSSLYAVQTYENFGFVKYSTIKIKDNIQYQEMELKIINHNE